MIKISVFISVILIGKLQSRELHIIKERRKIFHELSLIDGFKNDVNLQGSVMAESFVKAAKSSDSHIKNIGMDLKNTMEAFQVYSLISEVFPLEISEEALHRVGLWYKNSETFEKIKNSKIYLGSQSDAELQNIVQSFMTNVLPKISEKRKGLLLRVSENSGDLNLAVEMATLSFELTKKLSARRGVASSLSLRERLEMRKMIESQVRGSILLSNAFRLQSLSDVELASYAEFLETEHAKEYYQKRQNLLFKALKNSVEKAMENLRS